MTLLERMSANLVGIVKTLPDDEALAAIKVLVEHAQHQTRMFEYERHQQQLSDALALYRECVRPAP